MCTTVSNYLDFPSDMYNRIKIESLEVACAVYTVYTVYTTIYITVVSGTYQGLIRVGT